MSIRQQWHSPSSPGLSSLNQLLAWTREGGARPRLLAKSGGTWQMITAAEFYARVRALTEGFAGAWPAAAGERVAILSESRPEWLLADFACLAAGVIDVPVYPTLTAPQVAAILRDSGAVGVFAGAGLWEKLAALRPDVPALRWICHFDEPAWAAQLARPPREPDPDFLARMRATPSSQPATLLYTSGTTGEPKGLILTHGNLCANLNVSVMDFTFGANERRLSILPLSHITERHIAYADFLWDGATYFAESLDQVAANLLEVRPTVLVSVPRLFEKVAAGVKAQSEAKPALLRRIFAWSRRVGTACAPYALNGGRPPLGLRGRAWVARALVWHKLHARMGGKLEKIICGGAPLGKDLADFMLSMGVVVDEGYGLSETSPVVALNRPGGRRPGSIGRPLPNVEVRFAPDGELQVRGPSVFSEYYNQPEATAAAFDDGWFRTGDIGHQDSDGFLYITDRKKDLIKTSGGKFIAPQPIEAKLKASALIAEAVVVGDGRQYASVLLVPNWPAVAAAGLDCSNRPAACRDPRVVALFHAELDQVNATLARFETLKRFALLPDEFTQAAGELTPTIKVRRRTVADRYRDVIAGLYT